ncbi:hypothetical protein GPECTOR_20g484 [Gonium pectorale]|uniref:Autophagy-related protein 2 n=1 Tax=Gonium pectorale TaxID=33097 RepID=A0A150GII1_GONPE|nr:hypothetical protein GPECTOR_20g484 [Gonium pectorale]|eukprot:KXZ49627.1 hypothetical protein GPECTOR_20g484 [Gonium pectorale]
MLGTTDWLLKRFLKFVLKRNVGKYLTSEIDVEQLDVKLDTGSLELKNLLLNCEALNRDLALDGWHVKAGYVGSVTAKLPLVALSSGQCSVAINEVMLTVAPTPCKAHGRSSTSSDVAGGLPLDIPASGGSATTMAGRGSSSAGAMGFLLADDFGWTGHGAVMDGIKRIAGSLQSMLQHMRVEASNVLIRVELPHPTDRDRVVTAALRLDLVEFGDLSSAAPPTTGSAPGAATNGGSPGQPTAQQHKAQPVAPRPQGGVDGTSGTPAEGASAAGGGQREISKFVNVKGLSLDLLEAAPLITGAAAAVAAAAPSPPSPPAVLHGSGGAGVTLVSGPGKHGLQMSVEVRLVIPDDRSQPTQITADVDLGAVRLQLLPSHAVCLSALKLALDRVGGGAAGGPGKGACGDGAAGLFVPYSSVPADAPHGRHAADATGGGQWGQRSLFESIMIPDCEGVVAHSLEPYMYGTAGSLYGDASEFHDACSRIGSLANSLVNSVAQSGTDLLGYVAASGTAAVSGAMGWMGSAPAPEQPAQPLRGKEPPHVSVAAAAAAAAAAGASASAATEATAVPPAVRSIVSVAAHMSHMAVVLCYGPSQPSASSSPQPGRKGPQAAVARGAVFAGASAASRSAGAASGGGAASSATGGSLVLELQDMSYDLWLDEAHGSGMVLQAGQLQVYEQLPSSIGSKYGITAVEWGRVPEVLPQAPFRFRPSQPAPTRAHLGSPTSASASPRARPLLPVTVWLSLPLLHRVSEFAAPLGLGLEPEKRPANGQAAKATTVDLAAGFVELFLVRTGATDAAGSFEREPANAAGARPHARQQLQSGGASADSWALPWTSKLLFDLSPSPALPPPAGGGYRGAWGAPHPAPPVGPSDVPPGCGLHLHVCSDPGVGTAPELVSEAWSHAATHAQDRWADPDGEGGAWEERSSFRSVAFHEHCRRVAMYELVVEELTLFRGTGLGAQAGCSVTSLHTHGVTLMGHLEAPGTHPHSQPQSVAPAPTAAQQHQQQRHAGGAGPPLQQQQQAICLLHCPLASGAGDKAPAYIEYLCVEGPQPPAHRSMRSTPGGSPTAAASGRASQRSGAPWEGRPAAAGDTSIHSVLLQGVTISTDHGYVTMDWAAQLGALLASLPSPGAERGEGATAARQAQPQGQGQSGQAKAKSGRLSVNIVDLALRHEPVEYPVVAPAAGAPSAPAAAAAAPAAAISGGSASGSRSNSGSFAQRAFSSSSAAAAAAGTAAGASPSQPGGGGGRISPVALAVIIEGVHFGLPLGQPDAVAGGDSADSAAAEVTPLQPPPVHSVVLHSMTLHLAAADQRGPGWGASDPRGVREPLLAACGYHRVVQETSIRVVIKQKRYPRRPKPHAPPSDANLAAAAAAAAASPSGADGAGCDTPARCEAVPEYDTTLDVEVTNQHLLGVLTVESATLLAHFAMQTGTLMTARQAAAAAAAAVAAGAPPRRDGCRAVSSGPADVCWDATSEAGSVTTGAGGGSTLGQCVSEAGADAAGSLLTALLLDEVDENAFRRVPTAPAASDAVGLAASGAYGGGWYTAGAGVAASSAAGGASGPPGLILIDDFFPVNHQGEYDEDITLVQHPPRDGRAGWTGVAARTELEGTWYGPDEGPDRRPAAAGHYGPCGPGYHPIVAGSAPAAPSPIACAAASTTASGDSFPRPGDCFCDLDLCGPGRGPIGDDPDFLLSGGLTGPSCFDSDQEHDLEDVSLLEPAPAPGAGAGAGAGAGGQRVGGPWGASEPVAVPGPARAGGTAAPSVVSLGSSAGTRASSVPAYRLQEDYVRVPRKSDEDGSAPAAGCGAEPGRGLGGDAACAGAGSAAAGGGGGPGLAGGGVEQPPPAIRIRLKDLSGIWVMHTTPSASAAAAAPSAASAGTGGGGAQQQEGRVELVVEGLGLLLESYGPGGHMARHIKLTVHDLEIRDCVLDVRQQQAAAVSGGRGLAAAAAGGSGGAGWVRLLGYRSVPGQPRDSRAPLVAVALTAVRPNPAATDPRDEEFRLAVALLPLRLKLNQDVMSYLAWYGAAVSTALRPAAAVLSGMQAALSELGGCEPLPPPFFQRVQIRGFHVVLDYRPRRVDIAALAEGRLLELINLVPLGGVDLACKPLRLAGLAGWDELGAAVLREWLNDIARTQAHKFITGLAPVNAVIKVGSAVATVLAAPARQLARREGPGGQPLGTQVRRAAAGFARHLVCEALAAGRTAATGAGKAIVRVGSSALSAYGGTAAAYGGGPGYGFGMYDDDDGDGGEEGDEHAGVEGAGGGEGGAQGHGAGGGGGGRMRRSRSASAAVRKGLARAAITIGTASQQVTAGLQNGGLQRGVSNVARVIGAAAATGVSAAAPASAALQGQLRGTLRSVRRALRAQLQGPGQAPAQAGPPESHAKED